MRKTKFQNDYYYHIYNRGVDKRKVFIDEKEYLRFLKGLREFNDKKTYGGLYRKDHERGSASLREVEPLVAIICYALLPNHYHLLLRQVNESGISTYMHKLGTAYPMYFNSKYKRSGSLFQGRYKSVSVKTDEQLLYLSAYINGNAEIHKIARADKWKWSSYLDYLGKRNGVLVDKKIILKEFKNAKDYQEYTKKVIKNSREIKDEMKDFY